MYSTTITKTLINPNRTVRNPIYVRQPGVVWFPGEVLMAKEV